MSNGKGLLILAALCWLSLISNMLGSFIGRFQVTRKLAVVIQWQAFLLYLLGLVGTVGLIYSLHEKEDWIFIAILIAVFTLVPLVACSVQFYRAVRRPVPRAND